MDRSTQCASHLKVFLSCGLISLGVTPLAACGGVDSTEFDADLAGTVAPSSAGTQRSRSIHATLETSDDDLVILLTNDSHEDARVSLEVTVDTPDAHAISPLGEIDVSSGAQVRQVFAKQSVEGFDVSGSEWLRADLRYGFELMGGASGRKLTSMALRDGAVRDRDEAIAGGYQLPDMVLEGDTDELDKGIGDPFKICVTETMTFEGVAGGFIDDDLPVDLSPNTVNVLMSHFMVTARRGSVVNTVYLDSAGCTSNLARQTSGSETWSLDVYALAFFSGDMVYGSNASSAIPMHTISVTVPATGTQVSPPAFAFPSGEPRRLNTSTYLAYNAMRRLATINVTPQGTPQLRVSPSTELSPTRSFYCHGTNGTNCPTATTLRIGTDDATERHTIAHEFGHFIHSTYEPSIPISFTYSQGDADTFDTGSFVDQPGFETACANKRLNTNSVGAHNRSTIEWQSVAHTEGLAEFFQAVTYNDVNEDDCTIFQTASPFNCEAEGRSFKECKEWPDGNLYFMVGNELDWARMYWDFLTDYSINFHTYMLVEKDVTSWPTPMPPTVAGEGEHWIVIRNAMTSNSMKNAWNDASCLNLQDCTPSGRTQ